MVSVAPTPSAEVAARLVGEVATKAVDLYRQLDHDPDHFLSHGATAQAAIVRRVYGVPPLPDDDGMLAQAADELADHVRGHGSPVHGAFQKGYGEFLLLQYPGLAEATAQLIDKQWRQDRRIGHYELFSGLLMGDQDPAVLAPTLDEIHTNLRTWNNVGWCPWTPALWLRILWLGDGLLDTAASIGAQLTHIDEHLDATGCFQDREPFCLMHSVGLMGHRLGDRMLPRFANAIVTHQQPDGGWGEFSYIVYMLLRKWAVIA